MTKKLSDKRRAFVAAYIGPAAHNAAEAARLAGYAQPNMQGPRLMRNDAIRAAVEQSMTRVERSAVVTRQEALDLLSSAARGEWVESKPETGLDGSVTEVSETPIKPSDRLKAIQQLAKLEGWEAPKRVKDERMVALEERARTDPHGVADQLEELVRKLRAQAPRLEGGSDE